MHEAGFGGGSQARFVMSQRAYSGRTAHEIFPDGVLNHVGEVISTSAVVVVDTADEESGDALVDVDEDSDPPPQAATTIAAARVNATNAGRRSCPTDYSMRSPEMLRLMTRRWISEVPSKMVKILASRCQRSTGYSRV